MKILFVSDIYYPHIGGVSEHIYHLADEFEKKGHFVRILTGRMSGDFFPDEERVIRVGTGLTIKYNQSVGRITVVPNPYVVEDIVNRFDVVHIHGAVAPTFPLLALLFSKKTNIFTFHPTFDSSLPYLIFKKPLGYFFRRIDGLIAVSETARESFRKYFPGEYRIIPNGVDVKRFKPGKKKRNQILFVGRFEPRKGLDYLLKAMPEVIREIPDARLYVVGGGYRKFKINVPECVKSHIQFTGFVHPDQLPLYYGSSEVFVSPATGGESFGIVLIEAMASKTAVVASDIPGYKTVVKHMENGILVPPHSHEEIASAIIRILKDRKLKKKLVDNGLKTAHYYSWKNVANMVLDFYYEVNPSLP